MRRALMSSSAPHEHVTKTMFCVSLYYPEGGCAGVSQDCAPCLLGLGEIATEVDNVALPDAAE